MVDVTATQNLQGYVSSGVLVNRFKERYGAGLDGRSATLPETVVLVFNI